MSLEDFITKEKKRKYQREYMKKSRAEKRAKIIKILGEKCQVCGSTKNLEFHHDISLKLEKSGGIKEREEDWILKHIDEAILLHKSCHRRLHVTFKALSQGKQKTFYAMTPEEKKAYHRERVREFHRKHKERQKEYSRRYRAKKLLEKKKTSSEKG